MFTKPYIKPRESSEPYAVKSSTDDLDIAYTFYDPAIDLKASDLMQYGVHRDPAHLVVREGMTPIKFHLRPLSRPQLNRIRLKAHADVEREDGTTPGTALNMAMQTRAFIEGCVKITDCPVEQADGSTRLEEISVGEALQFMEAIVFEDVGERVLALSVLTISGKRSPGK